MSQSDRSSTIVQPYQRLSSTTVETDGLDAQLDRSATRPWVGGDRSDFFEMDAVTELVGETLDADVVVEPLPAGTVDLARTPLFSDAEGPVAAERFVIQGVLGEGSFGRVLLAYDRDIGREVAVKIFKSETGSDRGDVAREVQIAGRIEHPGVPPVYDVGCGDDGQIYCVMKRLEAVDLSELLERLRQNDPVTHERFPFYRRGQLIVQLLRIVMAAHAQKILHRDIKPANLLVDHTGDLMLIDWGVAIDLEKGNGAGRICGTPWYMAPEQTTGAPLDERTDVFAVGAVLYELLSLELACPTEMQVGDLMDAIPTHCPMPVDRIPHPCQGCAPSEYAAVVAKALARDPRERYGSAQEMLRALEDVQAGVFNAICPRTRIKSKLHTLMRWLDYDPFRNVPLLMVAVLGGAGLLVALGFVLGWAAG